MSVRILVGDWIEQMRTLPDASVQMIGPTSPPYLGLRDYGVSGQVGQEATPDEFVAVMVAGFREARRVLRADGILVLNLGDSYAGSGKGPSNSLQRPASCLNDGQLKNGAAPTSWVSVPDGLKAKDLMMIPFRVALALQTDGWWLRSVIPWVKRNGMPESVQDRPAASVEYLFLLSKSARYHWDGAAIKVKSTSNHPSGKGYARPEQMSRGGHGQDRRWEITPERAFRNSDPFFATWQGLWCDEDGDPLALLVNPQPFSGAHFATFPARLVEPFIRAGSRPGDTILDPFGGAGTVGLVASRLERNAVLCELNPEYAQMARDRLDRDTGPLFESSVTVEAPRTLDLFDVLAAEGVAG